VFFFASLSRRYDQAFRLLAAKDAELAALAAKGHKSDRALRTERLVCASFDDYVESELRSAPPSSLSLNPLVGLLLSHFGGVSLPAQSQSLPHSEDERDQAEEHQQSLSQQKYTASQSLSQSKQPVQNSLSPISQRKSPPKSVTSPKRPAKGGAVVIDANPNKKQKFVSRKNAFV
jgi:hypothetical protein